MNNSYKIGLAAVAASLALVGCGGGGTSTDTSAGTLVSVSNAPVYNATVTDANGQVASQVPGTYQYQFASAPTYPISASGGWMDINLNETYDAGTDVPLAYTMKSYATTVTPVTTFIADEDESVREAKLQKLSDDFNISTDILLNIPAEQAISEEAMRLAILAASLTRTKLANGDMNLTDVNTTFNDVMSAGFDETNITTFISGVEDEVTTQLINDGDLTTVGDNVTVSAGSLVGKTVYTTLPDEFFGIKITFSDDLTSIAWTDLLTGENGTNNIIANDENITVKMTDGDPDIIFSNVAVDANQATYYIATIDGTPSKLYFDETKLTYNSTNIAANLIETDVLPALLDTGADGYKLTVNISGALDQEDTVTYYFATDKFGDANGSPDQGVPTGTQYDYIAYSSNGTQYDIGFITPYSNSSKVELYSQQGKPNFTIYTWSPDNIQDDNILDLDTREGTTGIVTVTGIERLSPTVQ